MAYKSFNQRFPKFKWVLMFAVILALPLTVWSVNNVSTNTQQHAYIPPGDGGGPAPTGVKITSAPTGLKSTTRCTTNSSGKKVYTFLYTWKSVPIADNYQVVSYAKKSNGTVTTEESKPFSGTSIYHGAVNPPTISVTWRVRGYNSYSHTYGPYSEVKSASLVCN